MKRLALSGIALAAFTSWTAGAIYAQQSSLDTPVTQSSLATAVAPYSDYAGAYTLASMPSAALNAGKRILVTDLGGGPGYLRATNGCWKRTSTTTATVQSVPVATAITVDGLAMSPIVNLTGSSYAAKANITITNACSTPQITVVAGANVFTALGSLGLSAGGTPISVAGIGVSGTWNDYAISADGSTLTKIRGGSL